MRKLLLTIVLLAFAVLPVSAMEFEAPQVPDSAVGTMPDETATFSEGLWFIIKSGISKIRPDLTDAAGICLSIVAVVMLSAVTDCFADSVQQIIDLVSILIISAILLGTTKSMIGLGTQTVNSISEYGKLLMPVLTAAMAAQGGITSSSALYAGTMLFDSLLTSFIAKVLVPMIYIYLCLSIANRGTAQKLIGNLQESTKKTAVWMLKTILYVFTGYITVTGVVSGTTDAATLKAAKLTISGSVPVVGSILSDASEAVLVGAGVLRNSAGIYGLFAVLSVWIGPFLRIGVHYLLLKITVSFCEVIGGKQTIGILKDFCTAMGLILAMVGAACVLILISIICFLRGVGS